MNLVILIGHLGQEPEVKYTQDGTAVANFSIATNEKWKDKQTGEQREKTEWHRIVVWRRLAEICGEYLSKGQLVSITGKLQTRSWEKDGVTRYVTEIVANDMKMLTRGKEKQQGPPQQGPPSQGQGRYTGPAPDDDDIPF